MELLAYDMLSKESSKQVLEARIALQITSANVIENKDFDECLVIPASRAFQVTGPCPLNCGNRYIQRRAANDTLGHTGKVRLGLLIKILEAFEARDRQAAMQLVMQRDKAGRKYDVSHLCRTGPGKQCIQSSHIVKEEKAINNHRKPHQNGNLICSCVDSGYSPCMVKVFNDQGDHVGWAPARATKRRKVTTRGKA